MLYPKDCKKGELQYEQFWSDIKKTHLVQVDYRDATGQLFSTVKADFYSALINLRKQGAKGGKLDEEIMAIEAEQEQEDHSDDICPCGDPDCNRPFGHPEDIDLSIERDATHKYPR